MNSRDLSSVEEHAKGRVSAIWILPVLAALIGGWLVYKAIVEAPIIVTVEFDSAEGLEVGKTAVRYDGVVIGEVSGVIIQPDLTGVVVTLELDRRAEPAMVDGTEFWVVRPEVSLSGVTGLGTVLTGNYIALNIGDGAPKAHFVGLESEPPKSLDAPGLHLILRANDLGSISVGSPVVYKRFAIGDVQSYELDKNGKGITLNVFIKPEFTQLVRTSSRFWNASGISIKGGLTSFDIRTESMTSILRGGIGLTTIDEDNSGPPAKNNDEYALLDDFSEAEAGELINIELPVIPGIEPKVTKVVYRGITVGQVEEVNISKDLSTIMAVITLPPRSAEFLNKNTRFWVSRPLVSLDNVAAISDVLSGTRIELDFDDQGGDETRDFVALTTPPILKKDAPGLHITLTVARLESITRGMHVLYRNIVVGSVLDYRLSDDKQLIELDVHIEPDYSHLVNESSRFWDTGGIDISGGLDGFRIRTGSMRSILFGGIGFYTPDEQALSAKNGARFQLFSDYDSAHRFGVPITINFEDGDGLKEGTSIRYQGIEVGRVTSVELNRDFDGVVVKASLNTSASGVARLGTKFWLVKPELGLTKAANLGTLVTGQYISFHMGDGAPHYSFDALTGPPFVENEKTGLNIVLTSPELSSVKEGVTVSYRGVVVGKVTGYRLASSADHVKIFVNIEDRYVPLVRANSKFWNASGLDIGFKLFGGASIKSESVESILAGGISFATPDEPSMGDPVAEGASFALNSSRDERWLDWRPSIALDDTGEAR